MIEIKVNEGNQGFNVECKDYFIAYQDRQGNWHNVKAANSINDFGKPNGIEKINYEEGKSVTREDIESLRLGQCKEFTTTINVNSDIVADIIKEKQQELLQEIYSCFGVPKSCINRFNKSI